jgi:hypothetical protein
MLDSPSSLRDGFDSGYRSEAGAVRRINSRASQTAARARNDMIFALLGLAMW